MARIATIQETPNANVGAAAAISNLQGCTTRWSSLDTDGAGACRLAAAIHFCLAWQARGCRYPAARLPPVVQKIDATNSRVEMMVNTNRILKMDEPIPVAQVANPDLLDFTVLSDRQVQLHAKKPGITTVTLFGRKERSPRR